MSGCMAITNRLSEFIEGKNITRYKFAQVVGIAKNTVYNLCNNPDQIPDKAVMEKIFNAYPDTDFNALLRHIPDNRSDRFIKEE